MAGNIDGSTRVRRRRVGQLNIDPLGSDRRLGMRADRADSSAQAVALARAIESAEPASTRLFSDPLAAGFLDSGPRAIARLCRIPVLGDALLWLAEAASPGREDTYSGERASSMTLSAPQSIEASISSSFSEPVTTVGPIACQS